MKLKLPTNLLSSFKMPKFKRPSFSASSLRDIDWQKFHTHVRSIENKGFLATALVSTLVVGYTVLSQTTGRPDVTTSYSDAQPPKGSAGEGSKFVAVLGSIVEGELSNGWCPAKSLLSPSGLRTDSCSYQLGEREVFMRLSIALRDVMAYAGSRQSYDKDLDIAAGDLNTHPNVWWPFLGTTAYYGEAADSLAAYNLRIANGKTALPKRVGDIEAILNDVMRVTGDESSELGPTVNGSSWLIGSDRDTYFRTRGAFRVACDILQATRADYGKVIANQNAGTSFDNAVKAACAVAAEPLPDTYYWFSSNLNAEKNNLRGNSSTAVGLMLKAYGDLAGAPSLH